ncbi:nuclear cap binding protein [Perkinsela sp. CCAP 1560/4]|nr:nuclear cap binding protein [Perkinsela sp. CCAP 1560/4]|eukprot:KNH09750.1 nuclear cap binding protein [Perkinsela sp. CCAP 1560/4]
MSLLSAALDEYEVKNIPEAVAGKEYIDRRALSRSKLPESRFREKNKIMALQSNILYIGNLSLWTQERQLWKYFGTYFDGLEDIILGVNRNNKTSAGFCFIVFDSSEAALEAYQLIRFHDKHKKSQSLKLLDWHHCANLEPGLIDVTTQCLWGNPFSFDERGLRVDLDRGGDIRAEGRYWGRGYTGGQVRDEYRSTIDMARGGANARKFWEAKKCNRYIPSLNETSSNENINTDNYSKHDSDDHGENIRPVYDWLSFNVNQWKYKVNMDSHV